MQKGKTLENDGAHQSIDSGRLEAFSDGVIAVVITIMVLELRPPEGGEISDLFHGHLAATFLAYLLSFAFIGIYWNNHHHLLRATESISAAVMWANLHLLFWISLIPFITAWVGENYLETGPAAVYGFVGFMCGIAYFMLTLSIKKANPDSEFAKAIGSDLKGITSQVLYLLAICGAFLSPWISYAIFALVSFIWFIPERRLFN